VRLRWKEGLEEDDARTFQITTYRQPPHISLTRQSESLRELNDGCCSIDLSRTKPTGPESHSGSGTLHTIVCVALQRWTANSDRCAAELKIEHRIVGVVLARSEMLCDGP